MTIKKLMTMRLCLSFGAALSVASVLVSQRTGPAPNLEGQGIVFVYFPSMCAAANDASNCHVMVRPERPAFSSMQDCWAHADAELRRANDPRVLASCMKERES
jgi:hypothetical protein